MATLEEIQARREARRVATKAARDNRMAIDLEAITELEDEHGESNIATIEVPYVSDDLPVLAAVRTPKPAEIKRYQAMVRPRNVDGKMGDSTVAAETLAAVCVVYPAVEQRDALFESRPGLKVQLGLEAINLSRGQAIAEGKD